MISSKRLGEYSKRLEDGVYGRGNCCMSALLNVEAECLVSDIYTLRRGIRQISAYAKADDETYEIHEKLEKLLEGKFK